MFVLEAFEAARNDARAYVRQGFYPESLRPRLGVSAAAWTGGKGVMQHVADATHDTTVCLVCLRL